MNAIEQHTPRTAISLSEPGRHFRKRAQINQKLSLLTIRQLQFSISSQLIIERDDHAFRLLVNQHGMSMTECPAADILARNMDINALEHRQTKGKCLYAQPRSQMNGQHRKSTYKDLCRGEINSFSGLDALQPILDVPLQLRMEFLRKINGILVKERRLTNRSTRIFIEVCSFTRIDGVAGVLERWLKDH